jgi:hypothetical protein
MVTQYKPYRKRTLFKIIKMKIIVNPDLSTIDFSDSFLSAFFDGQGYKEVTPEIIEKITQGELIVTEYHEEPLGNVIYLSAKSINN